MGHASKPLDPEAPQMKTLSLLAVCLMSGCGMLPSLDELETEAMLTGDWSAVEQRERSIARRMAALPVQCPDGYVAICEENFADRNCACASGDSFRAMFSR